MLGNCLKPEQLLHTFFPFFIQSSPPDAYTFVTRVTVLYASKLEGIYTVICAGQNNRRILYRVQLIICSNVQKRQKEYHATVLLLSFFWRRHEQVQAAREALWRLHYPERHLPHPDRGH